MLEQFWLDLILNNKGRICYFHNWAGYDSILSMSALLSLTGYTFKPIVKNGEVMGLTILNLKGQVVLKIKDSVLILPGALGKLAKDWKVEVQKEHFPHYFFYGSLEGKTWSYLEVSRTYILGDVKALYQIMVQFFESLVSKFPIDPLSILSAPSAAFKIWRTVQLPLLHQDGLKVHDLSRTLDAKLREAYLGGIVDVYKPHLEGKG
jgi:hypothetical protein